MTQSSLARAQRSLVCGQESPLRASLGYDALIEQQVCREIVFDHDALAVDMFWNAQEAGLERWAPLMPPLLAGSGLGEGNTPEFALPGLLSVGDREVWIKDESRNPTGTHKDRLVRCVVSAVAEAGSTGIVAASSGNHALATAAFAAAANLKCIAVITAGVSPTIHEALTAYGATVIEAEADRRWGITRELVGDRSFGAATNLNPEFHAGHPAGPEGYKSISFEIVASIGVPAVVAVPVGYGELMFGIDKGFEELQRHGLIDRRPLVLGCETAVRPAMTRTLQHSEWSPVMVPAEPTRALSIGTTVPGYRPWYAVRHGHGRITAVGEEAIVQARNDLAAAGLYVETSSAASLAGLRDVTAATPELLEQGPLVIVNTSAGFREALIRNK